MILGRCGLKLGFKVEKNLLTQLFLVERQWLQEPASITDDVKTAASTQG